MVDTYRGLTETCSVCGKLRPAPVRIDKQSTAYLVALMDHYKVCIPRPVVTIPLPDVIEFDEE